MNILGVIHVWSDNKEAVAGSFRNELVVAYPIHVLKWTHCGMSNKKYILGLSISRPLLTIHFVFCKKQIVAGPYRVLQ